MWNLRDGFRQTLRDIRWFVSTVGHWLMRNRPAFDQARLPWTAEGISLKNTKQFIFFQSATDFSKVKIVQRATKSILAKLSKLIIISNRCVILRLVKIRCEVLSVFMDNLFSWSHFSIVVYSMFTLFSTLFADLFDSERHESSANKLNLKLETSLIFYLFLSLSSSCTFSCVSFFTLTNN